MTSKFGKGRICIKQSLFSAKKNGRPGNKFVVRLLNSIFTHCYMNISLPTNIPVTAALHLPPLIFGTSGLGNLFVALEE
jgi:hypothetical protein